MLMACVAFVFAQDVLPKIAEIQSVTGQVEIVNPKGEVRKPARFGTRLKNAEIRDEDKVKTGAGAQAVIVFPDASKFTLKEKSEMQVLQKLLPKASAEGQTVGRRLKVLFGELISEIAPNREINTVFETPAGSAAVRGTRLRLSTGGASMTLAVLDGTVRYFHKDYAARFDVTRDQRLRATQGSLIVEIEEDGGNPVTGGVGAKGVTLKKTQRIIIKDKAGNLDVTFDGPESPEGFTTPKGDGSASEDAGFDPNAETGPPMGEGPEPSAETGDALGETSTTLGTSLPPAVAGPNFIDDFERPNGDVGNGWTEETPENWTIANGHATVQAPESFTESFAAMSREIGFRSSWDIMGDFRYSAATMDVKLEVNADVGLSGCGATYSTSLGGTLVVIMDGTALAELNGIGIIPADQWFTLGTTFDGTNLCGSVLGGGVSASACGIATGAT